MVSVLIEWEIDEFCDVFNLFDIVGDGKIELLVIGLVLRFVNLNFI